MMYGNCWTLSASLPALIHAVLQVPGSLAAAREGVQINLAAL
jgi:hypothetical protein